VATTPVSIVGDAEVEDQAPAARVVSKCVFITAGPSTKLFTWGGGGIWEDMCYERRQAEACVD
jgi:hypothetical protein